MSATPIHGRRAVRALFAGMVCVVLLAGCTGQQKDASNYEGTEEPFLDGCEKIATEDNDAGAEIQITSPKTWCQCVFDALSNEVTGVPFDEFKSINSELRDNGGALPKDFQKAYDGCDPSMT